MTHRSVVITMGDPSGIGPEIICKSLLKGGLSRKNKYYIIGLKSVFEAVPAYRGVAGQKNISFIEIGGSRAVSKKKLTGLFCGRASVESLKQAVELIKSGRADALVTAPISKEHVKRAGFAFPGHTEFLCHEFNVKKYAMMLFHERLRVVLTTIHIPLKRVPAQISRRSVLEKLELTAEELKRAFKIKRPRLAVCGLNPHAGENGMMGDEEIRVIIPAIKLFRRKTAFSNVGVAGPLASDTVFCRALDGEFDAVLCHYHDQGLIALKTTGFHHAVNMTLGLPFVRTSPGHGTAFDIAGRGIADDRSMRAALAAATGGVSG
ncbi:MAG: 4-hydroxythreonine-4-phosphate dehydrogenase PdxA [Deltaproteobacteria bacterium]|nr:4-hydroxythreonine-4-phosphate dehydrogenase PdxA [Deltaproteobacteria bacterium]